MTVKEYIIDLFTNEKIEKISEKTLFKRLNLVKQSEKRELKAVLNQLCKEEVLYAAFIVCFQIADLSAER